MEKIQRSKLLSDIPQVDVVITMGCNVDCPYLPYKQIPANSEVIELPPCTMLYFQGASYETENHFGEAIGTLWKIIYSYDPTQYVWQYAPELAPCFNFDTFTKTGAKMARPVKKLMKTNENFV